MDEALAGAIHELIRMRDEGLVRAVGVGMNQWQAPLLMVRETGIDLVMLAGRWTLLDRSGQPLLDECAARVLARARALAGICARYGVSLPDAAIQFPLRHPAVVSVVSGMRNAEQVTSARSRFATVVPDDAWTELDAC